MENNPSKFVPSEEETKIRGILDTSGYPVENIAAKDCIEYISKLNKLKSTEMEFGKNTHFCLPDEDSWEYVCRAGKGVTKMELHGKTRGRMNSGSYFVPVP